MSSSNKIEVEKFNVGHARYVISYCYYYSHKTIVLGYVIKFKKHYHHVAVL